jgi:hypothetical protein
MAEFIDNRLAAPTANPFAKTNRANVRLNYRERAKTA